jgi:hypothetical protein
LATSSTLDARPHSALFFYEPQSFAGWQVGVFQRFLSVLVLASATGNRMPRRISAVLHEKLTAFLAGDSIEHVVGDVTHMDGSYQTIDR